MEVSVEFRAKLPVNIIRRRKWIVASCSILDLHSQGETEEKARKNLEEALSLFFTSCFERGTLDQALKNCGFKAISPLLAKRKSRGSARTEYIDVPIPFVVSQTKQTECHA